MSIKPAVRAGVGKLLLLHPLCRILQPIVAHGSKSCKTHQIDGAADVAVHEQHEAVHQVTVEQTHTHRVVLVVCRVHAEERFDACSRTSQGQEHGYLHLTCYSLCM